MFGREGARAPLSQLRIAACCSKDERVHQADSVAGNPNHEPTGVVSSTRPSTHARILRGEARSSVGCADVRSRNTENLFPDEAALKLQDRAIAKGGIRVPHMNAMCGTDEYIGQTKLLPAA